MSCTCDPCRKKFRINCGHTPEVEEGSCLYPDSYMVDFAVSYSGETDCRQDCIGPTYIKVECCDRSARLAGINGTLILQRVTTNAEIIDTRYWSSGQQNINTYQFLGNGGIFPQPYALFQIANPTSSKQFPCGPVATALFSFPNYSYPCDGVVKAFGCGLNLFNKEIQYQCFQAPDACDGSFTLQFGGIQLFFGSTFVVQSRDVFIDFSASLTFTPILPG